MEIAKSTARESLCIRAESQVGAVAVKNGCVIARGFNGALCTEYNCEKRGYCIRQRKDIPSGTAREIAYCICAEQRMICQSARHGVSLIGAEVYITHAPCAFCIRLMIECGVARAYYEIEYPQPFADVVAKEFNFELVKI